MRLIVCSFLISLASGSALLGAKECTWGPSYWCSSVTSAKQCQAVNHCMGTVWKYQIIKPQASTSCLVCESIVNTTKEMLQNEKTRDEVASKFSEACELLPQGDVRTECKGIVKWNLPILLEMLEKDINAEMICATLKICSGLESTTHHGIASDIKQGNTTCSDCKRFIVDVQNSVTSNDTVNQLVQLMDQTICNNLALVQPQCEDLMKQYVPLALQFLASQIDPDVVCRVLGFCLTEGSMSPVPFHIPVRDVFSHQTKPLTLGSDEECSVCKDLITDIDGFLRDQTVQNRIREEINYYICGALGSLKEQCEQLVDQYSTLAFDLLLNELDPKTICESIGVCKTPSRAAALKALFIGPVDDLESSLQTTSGSDIECTLCVDGFTLLETLVANISSDELLSYAKAACDIVPDATLKKTCNQYVEQYGPLVISFLKSGESPEDLCKLVKLCPASLTMQPPGPIISLREIVPAVEMKPAAAKVLTSSPVGGDVECALCESLIENLIKELGDSPSQAEIETLLEKVCDDLPEAYKSTCDSAIQTFTPVIVKMILDKAEPSKICQMIRFCSPSSTGVQAILRTVISPLDTLPVETMKGIFIVFLTDTLDSSLSCEVCNFFMKFIDEKLGQNATEEEINNFLKNDVCNLLPETIKDECKGFVNIYTPLIVDALKSVNASQVCTFIKACTAQEAVKQKMIFDKMEGFKSGTIVCEICELAISEVKSILSENKTKEEFMDELKKICDDLPSSLQDQCNAFVTEYGPLVFDLIQQDLQPNEICQEIGLCTAIKGLKKSQSPIKGVPVFACIMCDMAFKEVDSLLAEKSTHAEIRSALIEACTLIPDNLAPMCTDMVNTYLESIINYLVLEINPDLICEDLHLCTSPTMTKTVNKINGLIYQTKTPTKAIPKCTICEEVVQVMKILLAQNATEDEIMSLSIMICRFLPDTISQQCMDGAKQYVPAVLDYLRQELNAQEICQKMQFCSQTANGKNGLKDGTLRFKPSFSDQHLLGTKGKCEYGPAYWCASPQNAKECQAVDHCRRHVWKNDGKDRF